VLALKPNIAFSVPVPGASDTRLNGLLEALQHARPALRADVPPAFEALYRPHFDFVFRSIRRLGVAEAQIDDAVQDVFLVVLRRLSDYRPETNPRTWLFSIASRIAANHRRSHQRRHAGRSPLSEEHAEGSDGPFEHAARADAARLLQRFLDGLSDDKRDLFIMAELEEMSGPDIAVALGVNVNTVYSRVRGLRQEFADFFATHAGSSAR
jgi:RNA polymerase sigma-70 factor (ECF subfamily)